MTGPRGGGAGLGQARRRAKHPPKPSPRKQGSGAEPRGEQPVASPAVERRKASAPRKERAAARQMVCADRVGPSALRGHWLDAPFGAPLPPLFAGSGF